ncbi:3-oxoacyl-ACP reductase FabG [Pelomyxa schiedti]|nr:3-oxoacyl-ACP reductase FabG [Pelomyxa schiedti]
MATTTPAATTTVTDPLSLVGKVVVVTGAGRGIGAAIAEAIASKGANVVLADMDETTVNQTAAALSAKYGVTATPVVCNVAKTEDAVHLADVAQRLGSGKIWGIVNNAGITRDSLLKNMTEEQWDLVMSVNLKGTFLVTQKCTPFMISGCGGSIVNISSIVGKGGNIGQANYAASKAGMIGFTKTIAKEFARFKVRSNVVLPGFISTPMTANLPEKVVNVVLQQIPLGEMGKPEDISSAALYLLSDMARYVTGVTLDVSGGMFM